jgi:hypothetical protein
MEPTARALAWLLPSTFFLADDLAERLAVTEEIARDGLTDERHLGVALHLFLAEEPAGRDVPLAGREELQGDALDARGRSAPRAGWPRRRPR